MNLREDNIYFPVLCVCTANAIELGFKYLMTKKNIKIEKDHDLKELYKKLDAVEKIDEDYI